jgi:hypothetical protein
VVTVCSFGHVLSNNLITKMGGSNSVSHSYAQIYFRVLDLLFLILCAGLHVTYGGGDTPTRQSGHVRG